MRYAILSLIMTVTMAIASTVSAQERTTPFCKITSMETDQTWTYFSLPKSCFKQEKFEIRSDGNNNINVLAHLFAAHAGGLEVAVSWDIQGFGPTVLGIKTRPPS